MNRIGRIALLTLSIIGCSFLLTLATSHKVRAAVSALVTVGNTAANPIPTQSMDAQTAFETTFQLGFGSQTVTIPAGQRLVIDFVTIDGVANSNSGPVQPVFFLNTTLANGGSGDFVLEPAPSPVSLPGEGQVTIAQPVKIYADTLSISAGFAGYSPNNFTFNVSISGHLVPIS